MCWNLSISGRNSSNSGEDLWTTFSYDIYPLLLFDDHARYLGFFIMRVADAVILAGLFLAIGIACAWMDGGVGNIIHLIKRLYASLSCARGLS